MTFENSSRKAAKYTRHQKQNSDMHICLFQTYFDCKQVLHNVP